MPGLFHVQSKLCNFLINANLHASFQHLLQQPLPMACTAMEVQVLDAVDVLDVEEDESLLAEDARKLLREAMLPLQKMFLCMPKRNSGDT